MSSEIPHAKAASSFLPDRKEVASTSTIALMRTPGANDAGPAVTTACATPVVARLQPMTRAGTAPDANVVAVGTSRRLRQDCDCACGCCAALMVDVGDARLSSASVSLCSISAASALSAPAPLLWPEIGRAHV